MVGQTISPYKITAKLGEGGMGVVYKAEDTKLKRPVALKFLRSEAIEDDERRQRFLREAQAAASLDHPNICTIYEIGEADGQTFLSMAFLEGRTVKAKLKQRPLKLDEALDIACQTARGLQAAHERGVVHRDIKGANLMLTPQGQVKIMDFGLAQLAERSQLTKTATILGTPAYMSPEQAKRQPTDRRTDVWSLGVVIYEMVTGRLPFEGEREDAVAYSIVHQEPEPITAQRVGVPTDLDRIVGKAMAKSPDERYQHVDEMLVDLRSLRKLGLSKAKEPLPRESSGGSAGESRARAEHEKASLTQAAARRLRIAVLASSVVTLAALATLLTMWGGRPDQSEPLPLVRFSLDPGFDVQAPVVSPSGQYIVYVASVDGRGQLWVWDLEQEEARAIEGAEDAQFPFWSPDSDFIGFATRKELKKVPVAGGLPTVLCSVPSPFFRGGTWSPDGTRIVFGGGSPGRLYQVPAQGGERGLLITPRESDKAFYFRHPQFLPRSDDRAALIFGVGPELRVRDLDTNEERVLSTDAHHPFYSPTGHILYQTAFYVASDLWALPFSIEKLEPTGEAFSVDQNSAGVSVADNGTLVYHDSVSATQWQLVWRDRAGKKVGAIGRPQSVVQYPDLSPNDQRVVVRGFEKENFDIWVHDVRRPVKTRLTFGARNIFPNWSPTGDQIAFTSSRNGSMDIFTLAADGSGEAEMLVGTPPQELVTDWSPDGQSILYYKVTPNGSTDLWYLRRGSGDRFEPAPFFTTPFWESEGQFSPNGRFVAYTSDESGRREVYVRPFPEGEVHWQVSSEGGNQPRWSGDGGELFYVQRDTLVAVRVNSNATFSAGLPRKLFASQFLKSRQYAQYDVSLDGQRFVVAERLGEHTQRHIRVIQNWISAFRGDSEK